MRGDVKRRGVLHSGRKTARLALSAFFQQEEVFCFGIIGVGVFLAFGVSLVSGAFI